MIQGFIAENWKKKLVGLPVEDSFNIDGNLFVVLNKNIFSKEESNFILELDRKVKQRSEDFNERDKKISLNILEKLNKELF